MFNLHRTCSKCLLEPAFERLTGHRQDSVPAVRVHAGLVPIRRVPRQYDPRGLQLSLLASARGAAGRGAARRPQRGGLRRRSQVSRLRRRRVRQVSAFELRVGGGWGSHSPIADNSI